jgi:hypothetical protein
MIACTPIFCFSLDQQVDMEFYTEANDKKVFYCLLNKYKSELAKEKGEHAKFFTEREKASLYKKIQNSEFGDLSFDTEGYESFLETISENNNACSKTYFLNTRTSIGKYDKDKGYFTFNGPIKGTYYKFNSSIHSSRLFFQNADANKNKIVLPLDKAQDFVGNFGKYNRDAVLRIYFNIVDGDINLQRKREGYDTDIKAHISKMEILSSDGKMLHTEQVKISYLDKYIDLEKNEILIMNRHTYGLIKHILNIEKINYEELALMVSKRIKNANQFDRVKMMKEAMPELQSLVDKIKNQEILLRYNVSLPMKYSIDDEEYKINAAGYENGYLFKDVSLDKDLISLSMKSSGKFFAINIPSSISSWKINANSAQELESKAGIVYLKYSMIIKPLKTSIKELSPSLREYFTMEHFPNQPFDPSVKSYLYAYKTADSIELEIIEAEIDFVHNDKVLFSEKYTKPRAGVKLE